MILERTSLCNEVLRDHAFADQCRIAAQLGYSGLEVAPFTLSDDPVSLPAETRRELRRTAEDAGLAITGLHWLTTVPEGLSITDPDRRQQAIDHLEGLVELCADLGGTVLVHGSPGQRQLSDAPSPDAGRANAREIFERAGEAAGKAGLTYCVEPLAPHQTDYMISVAEADELVRDIGNPALTTMIDVCAASAGESVAPDALVREWVPRGVIAHIHLNAPNRKSPGQDDLRFGPILRAAIAAGFQGRFAVEPFVYEPDGVGAAALAAGYLRALGQELEAGQ